MSREMACVYYDNQKCKKFEEPGYVSWCVLGPCAHQTPSNADRIRTMSDEELVEILITTRCQECPADPICNLPTGNFGKCRGTCAPQIVKWLQQPAEEISDGGTIGYGK